ncbi:nucleic-acid-binding protein from transposon X-element [Trichonephila clavipes]|nr:nucleic-acid-binding protein from transposon X-element [Trichonephila clavipes]
MGVIDPPFQLTLFDDYIQWVPVVKYLGLHIDSRLTFKKHIDYLSEKFWGRISLAISLVGRRSPLSLENKVILYKQILRPVITYGSPVWGAAAATHMKKYKRCRAVARVPSNFSFRANLPIVIDSQSNATELLDQLGKFCDTPLEGRFENGKLRVFPASAEEHRLIQKYISDKKLRSHTFEMAHNKQLKVVLRGLPTDFNQEELMSELHSFGFQPNHISLLRNRKTNTNMPLFLVTLPKSPESRGIFNIKTIGFFRVAVEPLNKSTMPPQCYRCQEFFHHSRFCARAPKCLKNLRRPSHL